jgi:hypothetical protein
MLSHTNLVANALNVIATELDERKRVSADRADAALARFKKAYARSK